MRSSRTLVFTGSVDLGSKVQGFWVSLVPMFYLGMQLHKKFQFVFLFRDIADRKAASLIEEETDEPNIERPTSNVE
jgi:hypothetical protein